MIEIKESINEGVIEAILGEAGFELRMREQWSGKDIINTQFVRSGFCKGLSRWESSYVKDSVEKVT